MKKIVSFLIIMFVFGCSKPTFDPDWTTEKAPEKFTARFETTKGNFDIEVERKLSPAAADRVFQLVSHDYYDNAIFYRVLPQYLAQFGNTNTAIMKQWQAVRIPDEPVVLSNKKGTVSFARYGKDSRDLELFINLNNNPELDTTVVDGVKGYPAFGNVVKGMDVVESLHSGYGDRSMQASEIMYNDRNDFLRTFPALDVIKKAYLISE
ncbi:MAG: peptidylprolyl isomerase [Flavobacterium sp.]|uniref:peptidylprolyl isomerase n=1 Tax=Flavobacterium sp. TaxID=239 RepID=UPI0011FD8F25|nr:peptidylprolyl isomerase [Flavobacterium sp.]RZJ65582.1 MAG: peptidylprolyl isomerase [Flavobacterium sp.]